ncbi:MAG: DUF397 domain-containing protein [Actinomadura sp.]
MSTVDFASVRWRKSSRSGQEGGTCVELADLTAAVAVRDSKNPDGPELLFSRREFGSLVERIKSGDLDG